MVIQFTDLFLEQSFRQVMQIRESGKKNHSRTFMKMHIFCPHLILDGLMTNRDFQNYSS
jgi:hypothetical protein